jgi:hypothetical protein
MEDMAVLVNKAYAYFHDRKLSFGKHLGSLSQLHTKDRNNYASWITPTYYFPSNNNHTQSVLPEDDQDHDHSESEVPEENEKEYDYEDVDEWGFVSVEGGKFYNTFTKEYFDQHPIPD